MVRHNRQQCPGGRTYTIRAGDTFFTIARRFDLSVDALLEANPDVDPDNLRVGQVICLPGVPEPEPECPNGTLYTIRAGDTLFSIARRYNVSVDAILRANPGLDPDNLQVGRIICIPGVMPGECPAGSFAYTIRQGDTLFRLANEFDTTVSAIQRLNPGIDPNNLRVGMRICIPGEEPTECPPGSREYTIRAGDTFFRLAQRFGVSVDDIIAANPGVDPNRLQVGQVVCIPQPDVPPCPGGRLYVIRPGDNLFVIARRNNISLERLIAANPQIEDPDVVSVGETICIPPASGMMAQQRQCPAGTNPYVIRSGDTFFSLAQRFNTTVAAIQAANPGVNPNNLRVGQTICIPGGNGPQPGRCPAGTTPYVIRSGDTYFALAQRFNTTVDAIRNANPNVDPNNLRVGQTICIPEGNGPQPGRCPAGTTPYVVRSGDTYFALAQRFNTTVDAIRNANPNVDPNNLQVGQTICIPGGNGPQPGRCPAGTTPYVIRSGDTFFSLAQRFNTTVEAIQAANPGVNPNRLQVGQEICIPRS
ncbi:LysM peptidoglycan-binding domain-containing protein [Peptococcaceae bacterium 1198_IL3148]